MGIAPETSLLMGAVPAQGAPGEQGPAGRCVLLSRVKFRHFHLVPSTFTFNN